MANLFKVIFLGVLGFFALVYFTAQKPKQISSKEAKSSIKYEKIPNNLKNILKENTYIIVASYDAMLVFKDINKYLGLKKPIILVPNISNTSWAMKKLFVESKLEELKNTTDEIVLYDKNSSLANILNIYSTQNKFYIYKIENKLIKLVYKNKIKENLYQENLSKKQILEILSPLKKIF
ncbi:MAG: hypothetical protein KGV43_02270 [Arcobacter sp.]|nr:hypothetical protein [Arcobacter sp.]